MLNDRNDKLWRAKNPESFDNSRNDQLFVSQETGVHGDARIRLHENRHLDLHGTTVSS